MTTTRPPDLSTTLLRAALAAANGRRRVRTLDESGVIQAVREAITDGYGWVASGTPVANCYGYPAERTSVLAGRRTDGGVTVGIGACGATKGAAPRPSRLAGVIPTIRPDGPRVRAAILAWADRPLPEDVVLPRRAALRLVREDAMLTVEERRLSATELAAVGTGTMVTAGDSLAAGNCPRETARVAAWWPRLSEVPAGTLLRRVARRAPHLLPFARRAVAEGQRRTERATA
jgi:hypothetical protein